MNHFCSMSVLTKIMLSIPRYLVCANFDTLDMFYLVCIWGKQLVSLCLPYLLCYVNCGSTVTNKLY